MFRQSGDRGSEEGISCPRAGATGSCEMPCSCLGPLQEQKALSITEPFPTVPGEGLFVCLFVFETLRLACLPSRLKEEVSTEEGMRR